MVVVSFSKKELQEKLGLKGTEWQKELGETLFKIGMELESGNSAEEEIEIDIAGAGNRLDTVSLEGLVRVVLAYRGKYSFKYPKLTKAKGAVVNVDKSVADVRPYIGNFIVRGIDIDDSTLKRIINLQEKIASTFGRDRKVLGMGLFKLSQLKFPLTYVALPAEQIKFAPLGFKEEMAGDEILKKHEKGIAYAHLFSGKNKLPILRDASGKILTMPGITNSNDLGKVSVGKQDLFVEATGTNLQMIRQLLAANALDFADMGGKIESVAVKYPTNDKVIEFPEWDFEKYSLNLQQANNLLGLNLTAAQAVQLLKKMMLPAVAKGSQLQVSVPRFRSDIVHWVDLVEDIARAYGFDSFVPQPPSVHTFGKKHEKTRLFNEIINSFTGLGFQQVVGMILASKEDQTVRVKKPDDGKFVELYSSRALGLNCCRRSLYPGLLAIISSNKQYSYPQKIFEVGECLEVDTLQETGAKTSWKAAALLASADASFAQAKSLVESFGRCLDDYELKIEPLKEKSPEAALFILGRAARITGKYFSGTFGEVDIEILRNFGIEMPCVLIEVELKQ